MKLEKFILGLLILSALSPLSWGLENQKTFLVHAILSETPVKMDKGHLYVRQEAGLNHALFVVKEDGTVSLPYVFGRNGWVLPEPGENVAFLFSEGPGDSTEISKVSLPDLKELPGEKIVVPFPRMLSANSYGMWTAAPRGFIRPKKDVLLMRVNPSIDSPVRRELGVAVDLKTGKYNQFLTGPDQAFGVLCDLHNPDYSLMIFEAGAAYIIDTSGDDITKIKSALLPEPVQKALALPPGQAAFYRCISEMKQNTMLSVVTSNVSGKSLRQIGWVEAGAKMVPEMKNLLSLTEYSGDPAFLCWDPGLMRAAIGFQNYKYDGEKSFVTSTLLLVDLNGGKISKTLQLDGLSALTFDKESLYYALSNRLYSLSKNWNDEGREIGQIPARRILEIFPLEGK